MKNFNGSLSDLGVVKNEEENSFEKEGKKSIKPLQFKNFNDSPTDFNNEIIVNEPYINTYEINLTQEDNENEL